MSQLVTATIGSYPRIGEQSDHQRYRRGRGHFLKKEISAHAFRDVEQSVVQETLIEQADAGLDEVTDGLIAWQDPISHFCKNLTNVEPGGLVRYFDNNFYYRVPTLSGKPRISAPVIAPEFSFAKSQCNKPVRAVLMGPVTLARLTLGEKTFAKMPARVDFFTEVLLKELAALRAAGATTLQIDEPALTFFPEDGKVFRKSLEKLAVFDSATSVLALYYGDPAAAFSVVADLPFRGFQLDFTVDPDRLTKLLLARKPDATIGFGVLDARSTRRESAETALMPVRRWWDAGGKPKAYLTPSAGLESLTREAALTKIKWLGALRQSLSSSLSNPSSHAA